MRARGAFLLMVSLGALGACEKRERTRNSSGSTDLFEEGATTGSTNVYRFVGVEQTLTDARKAVSAEKWDQVIAATDALLKQQPGNAEAKQLGAQARVELPSLARWNELNKAAAAGEVAQAVRQYRAIPEASIYRARAGEAIEKLKNAYVENQLGDARGLVKAGRCDEARHTARVTGDLFPESRARLDEAASDCKQIAKADPAPAPAPMPAPASAALAPAPARAPAPAAASARTNAPASAPAVAAAAKGGRVDPGEARSLAASVPASSPVASLTPMPAPPAAPPAPSATPLPAPGAPSPTAIRTIPMSELEGLRTAGDRAPPLPANAKVAASRNSVKRITMVLKLCVSDHGVPTSVGMPKPSDYPEANETVMAEVKKWRFRPYLASGEAVPVCTAAVLNYQIE